MLKFDIINKEILEKLFEHTDKLLLCINKDTKIIDYNETFEPYSHIKYLNELITYTHLNEFTSNLNKLCEQTPVLKFMTNFSFDKNDIEDIPCTYQVIIYLSDEEHIYLLADPKPSLSHNDAKVYLSLVNDYSQTSRELTKTKNKLQKLNNNLEKEVEKAVTELRAKDEILLKQAKDAAMGEMIDSIAHQWKNPLSIINMLSQSINLEYELMDEPDIKHILAQSNKIQETVHHLVETLEEFRSFFRPNIPLQEVTLKEMIDSVHLLMKDQLVINSVQTNIIGDPTLTVKIIPNQFKHVLINLLNNSKDAFNEQNIENKLVEYEISKNGSKILLKIIDNAGGIPENIIDHIFEANFTTKAEGKGTGIGLYMTQQIIDKIGATIKVQNVKDGTCFCIEFDDIKNDEL